MSDWIKNDVSFIKVTIMPKYRYDNGKEIGNVEDILTAGGFMWREGKDTTLKGIANNIRQLVYEADEHDINNFNGMDYNKLNTMNSMTVYALINDGGPFEIGNYILLIDEITFKE